MGLQEGSIPGKAVRCLQCLLDILAVTMGPGHCFWFRTCFWGAGYGWDLPMLAGSLSAYLLPSLVGAKQ